MYQCAFIFGLLVIAINEAVGVNQQCQPNSCNGNGVCNDKTGKIQCWCFSGRLGDYCQDPDPCHTDPCQKRGKCVADNSTTGYHCDCWKGFKGQNCTERTTSCSSNTCHNGGVCRDQGTTYVCECPAKFTGRNCETESSFCDTSPCNSHDRHAKCEEEPTGYTCTCSSSEYFGLLCENKPQGCVNHEESYCVCTVDNLPVKVPLPDPSPYTGIDTRDVISGFTGIGIGWLLGTLLLCLWRYCCYGVCSGGLIGERTKGIRPDKPWLRPDSASSGVTTTTGTSIRSVTPTQVRPVSSSTNSERGTNIYRAAFTDDLSHTVSSRKSSDTYISGAKDW